MQSVLQKIDRVNKPIRKNTKIVSENLNKKNIFLEQDNFDILKLLQSRQNDPKLEKVDTKKQRGAKRKFNDPEEFIPKEFNQKRPQLKDEIKLSKMRMEEVNTPIKVSPGMLTPENRNSPIIDYGFSRELIKNDEIEELSKPLHRELQLCAQAVSDTVTPKKLNKRDEKKKDKKDKKKKQLEDIQQ